MEGAFRAALDDEARPRFEGDTTLAETLARLRGGRRRVSRRSSSTPPVFAAELARRLGAAPAPSCSRACAPITCTSRSRAPTATSVAIRRFEAEFLDEVDACARRLRARDGSGRRGAQPPAPDPVRQRARADRRRCAEYSGRGDLRSYLRVIATRELVRVIDKRSPRGRDRDESFLDKLSPVSDPELGYLREAYRPDVDAAMRAALAGLGDESRALLRYSLIDGWSVDRIGALYGVHRATAARRVAAAREELGERDPRRARGAPRDLRSTRSTRSCAWCRAGSTCRSSACSGDAAVTLGISRLAISRDGSRRAPPYHPLVPDRLVTMRSARF